jgi:hypothetical protein
MAEEEMFIDRGACPGERCIYCALYVADADIVVYKSPSYGAEKIGKIKSGDAFITKTGEVHTAPGRFTVFQKYKKFKPGDEVYVLTYLGEGFFRVRHNGELREAELGFSPWDGSWNGQCDSSDTCWGGLEEKLNYTWWLNIVSEKEVQGWIVYSSSAREIGVL